MDMTRVVAGFSAVARVDHAQFIHFSYPTNKTNPTLYPHRPSPNRLQPIHPPRLIRQRGNAEPMPQPLLRVMHVVVRDGRMRRHTVIPERHGSLLPLDSDLEVLTLRDVLEEQLEEDGGLLVAEADDALCEARVDEEGFLAGCLGRVSGREGLGKGRGRTG